MAILKDLAQVLRVYEHGNTSLVTVLLGRRLGQFRVLIKGGRRWPKKAFEGGFDLLTRGEILVYPRRGESLWIFKEWEERERPKLGHDLAQLRAASFLCELAEALTRPQAGAGGELLNPVYLNGGRSKRRPAVASAQPDSTEGRAESGAALYDTLALAADALASGAQAGPVLLNFTLRSLACEGLLPPLDVCGACGKTFAKNPRGAFLSGRGVFCADCLAREAAQAPLGVSGGRTRWTPGNATAASLNLPPPVHSALMRLCGSARPFGPNAATALQLARALVVLVHGALERDLRTLPGAARLVRMMQA